MYLQLQVFFFKEPARVSYVFEQLFGDTKDHGFTDIDVTVSESHLQSVHRILTSSIYCTYDYRVPCCLFYQPSVQEKLQEIC